MTAHRRMRIMLYEYLQNDLSPSDRTNVEAHVASCRKCMKELHLMRSTLGMLASATGPASDERSEQFWKEFSTSVLRKAQKSKRGNPLLEAGEWIEELLMLHPKYAYATTGTLAALLVVFAVWTFYPPRTRDKAFNGHSVTLEHAATQESSLQENPGPSTLTPERVSQYFRKSKTLLVGLTNLRTDQAEPIDFSQERRVSRDLIQEARYLKKQPIDPRSRQVMADMERILIELSNIEGHRDMPNVEIIRNGIHHENLLFKIRMAEAMYDSANLIYAGERR